MRFHHGNCPGAAAIAKIAAFRREAEGLRPLRTRMTGGLAVRNIEPAALGILVGLS
jgi:hypothetical protein